MLAPGEYLTIPAPPEPTLAPPPEGGGTPTAATAQAPAPLAETEKSEPRTFLEILLNALGAIHT